MIKNAVDTKEEALAFGGRGSADSCQEPDGRLAEAAEGHLRKSGHFGLRSVSCESRQGVLVLRGRVSSYYCKQLAQELVRRINGAETIVNRVEVCTQ
jgi:osmotically-inducible protein OsmY